MAFRALAFHIENVLRDHRVKVYRAFSLVKDQTVLNCCDTCECVCPDQDDD